MQYPEGQPEEQHKIIGTRTIAVYGPGGQTLCVLMTVRTS